MKIPKKIKDEIWEYCRVNDITDVEGFTKRMLKQGFTVERFGATPSVVEKEVEVEKIVEVEVEKIVEKEVIKKIEVEKIVKVTDNEEMQKSFDKIKVLKSEIIQLKDNITGKTNDKLRYERENGELLLKLGNDNTKLKERLEECKPLETKLKIAQNRITELEVELKAARGGKKDFYGER